MIHAKKVVIQFVKKKYTHNSAQFNAWALRLGKQTLISREAWKKYSA